MILIFTLKGKLYCICINRDRNDEATSFGVEEGNGKLSEINCPENQCEWSRHMKLQGT